MLPMFNGNSYTCINGTGNLFQLKFSFNTGTPNGVLAYANTSNGYISIGLQNGFVVLDTAQGNNTILLEEADRIFSDGIWHDILIGREVDGILYLFVDDQKYSEATLQVAGPVELSGDLCFGGIAFHKQLFGVHAQFYTGSVASMIELNEDAVNILMDSIDGANIGNPMQSSCDPYVCNSNGNCRESDSNDDGFICDCYFGYQGQYCGEGK